MAAKRKRNLLDSRLQNSGTPLCVLDGTRRLRFVSPGFEQLTGYNGADLEGLVCEPSSSGNAVELLAAGLTPGPDVLQGKLQTVETVLPHKTGSGLRCRLTFVPIADDDHSVDRILLLCSTTADRTTGTSASLAQRLHAELTALRTEHRRRFDGPSMVGQSAAIQRALKQAEMLAASDAPYSIIGPAGSGRRHMARLIHSTSGHSESSLVVLSCRLLTAEQLLIAIRQLRKDQSDPSARRLHCGTLVLFDADLFPREIQSWMLETKAIADTGIRVVAISEESPLRLQSEGWLLPEAAELFTTVSINLPRLHDRPEDVPLLAQHFITECRRLNDTSAESLTQEVLDEFLFYRWPGNIAELRQVVFEACQNSFSDRIETQDLPFSFRAGLQAQQLPQEPEVLSQSLEQLLKTFETDVISATLDSCNGNKAEAARRLGMTRPRLYRRMRTLDMETDEP